MQSVLSLVKSRWDPGKLRAPEGVQKCRLCQFSAVEAALHSVFISFHVLLLLLVTYWDAWQAGDSPALCIHLAILLWQRQVIKSSPAEVLPCL